MVNFKVCNRKIEFDDNFEQYNSLRRPFADAAYELYVILEDAYDEFNDIGEVISKFPSAVSEFLDITLNEVIKDLYKCGVYDFTLEDFLKKYYYKKIDYSIYVDPIIERYSIIEGKRQQLEEYREMQRASKSRWIGGGFGLKGAIKGSITAGVLNCGTDFIRSFGESSEDKKDRELIYAQKKALYKDEKVRASLIDGAEACVLNCLDSLYEELCERNIVQKVNLNSDKAHKIFSNTLKYEENQNRIIENIVDSIQLYPYEYHFYIPLLKIDAADEGLNLLIDYVGLTSRCSYYKKQDLNDKICCEQLGNLNKLNLKNISQYNYDRAAELCMNIQKEYGEFPESNPYYYKLKKFMDKCASNGYNYKYAQLKDYEYHNYDELGKESDKYLNYTEAKRFEKYFQMELDKAYYGKAVYITSSESGNELPIVAYHILESIYDSENEKILCVLHYAPDQLNAKWEYKNEADMSMNFSGIIITDKRCIVHFPSENIFEKILIDQIICIDISGIVQSFIYLSTKDGGEHKYPIDSNMECKNEFIKSFNRAIFRFNRPNYYYPTYDKNCSEEELKIFQEKTLEGDSECAESLGILYRSFVASSKFKWYEDLANANLPNSGVICYWVAEVYSKGNSGIQIDEEKAFKYYKLASVKAADNTYAKVGAIFELACCYENGKGVEKDVKKALENHFTVTKVGTNFIFYAFSEMHIYMLLIKDIQMKEETAITWLIRAEKDGEENAAYLLGTKYLNGIGVPKNINLAISCFQKAYSAGVPNAKEKVELAKKMKKEEEKKAIKETKSKNSKYLSKDNNKKDEMKSGVEKEQVTVTKLVSEPKKEVKKKSKFTIIGLVVLLSDVFLLCAIPIVSIIVPACGVYLSNKGKKEDNSVMAKVCIALEVFYILIGIMVLF